MRVLSKVLTKGSDIIKIILAIFLPPLGVFLERGCNADFFINILLTILGYIPVCPVLAAYLVHAHANRNRVSSTRFTLS